MKIVHRALVAVVALLAVASLSSCAPGTAETGAITVRTTDTTASETLTVSVVDLTGHTVRQATGPGTGWSATFTDVPAGRYRVRLLIAQPVAHGTGTATSESVLTQCPLVVTVGAGGATTLTYDGRDWTAVQ